MNDWRGVPHQDGAGYNIVLQALPIDGRVVLRVPKDDDAPREQQSTVTNIKSGPRRR